MKIYFVSMGCPKNTVDMESALALLDGTGCRVASDPRAADVLVVNACSFLDSAWNETVEEIERLRDIKHANGTKKLVLMGCLPNHRDENLKKTLPDVDYFVPTGKHGLLPGLIRSWREESPGVDDKLVGNRFAGFEERSLLTPPHTAYVKISEGCSHSCAFCAIPQIKGPVVSRDPESIEREVSRLVGRGVKEITLIAQDTAAYASSGIRLATLVEKLAALGIPWIRVLYAHPASLSDDALKQLFEVPAVCRYLDIPIQHASDRVLERMGRPTSRRYLTDLFTNLKKNVPDIALRSEVIVGYPGEEDEDFEQLKEFISFIGFASLGIFPFSREKGTPAWELEDNVPQELVEARYSELLSLQESCSFASNSERVGHIYNVLIDRTDRETDGDTAGASCTGRYYGQAYEIDGEVHLDGKGITAGDFARVRIVDNDVFDLSGEVVSS